MRLGRGSNPENRVVEASRRASTVPARATRAFGTRSTSLARCRASSAHYAFLISEVEFDEIFARIEARGLPYWADPGASRPQEINRNDGGRGVYFREPAGHYLEIITRPYGG